MWLEKIKMYLEKTIAITLVLIIWETFPKMGVVDARFLPPFSSVVVSLFELVVNGQLIIHLTASIKRSAVGFAMAIVAAIPLGILVGRFKRLEWMLDPVLQVCRNTTVLALYPVFMLVFGLGEFSKFGIIFWGAVWPILINTIDGVKSVDPVLTKAARSMGASRTILMYKVILPAAVPSIATGFRLSATRSVLLLIAAEMLGAKTGLGYLIFYSQEMNEIPAMYAGIISIIGIGMAVNFFLILFEKHVTKWKEQVE